MVNMAHRRTSLPAPCQRSGFTLIELLVVLAVLAILLAMIVPNYLDRIAQARETVLKHDLVSLRIAIDQFYRDKARYPGSLDELVTMRYIREVPDDPITERRDSWVLVPPVTGVGVFNVKSGATGTASDGSVYADW